MKPPIHEIDPKAFWQNPYPDLATMRGRNPICRVPQLNATLITKREAISACEKNIAVFSSEQPQGLMTRLMGENMMRKDGEAHQNERKQAFPSFSPRTVLQLWKARFEDETAAVIETLKGRDRFDIVKDYAMPVSGHALRHITGLLQLEAHEIDETSQAMIDGIGNYLADPTVEARCHAATAKLDAAIDEKLAQTMPDEDKSLVAVLKAAGQPLDSIRANVKLAISGGQNEPRDAIAGAAWTLMTHPEQLALVRSDAATWQNVFEEYARWISPIGMSPREIRQEHTVDGVDFTPGERVFLMFSSANRDEDIFSAPDRFDVTRDTSKAIAFGAGPHFCAGAAASRCLISEVALPMLFDAFPAIRLDGDVAFGGWAFRGPLSVPVRVD